MYKSHKQISKITNKNNCILEIKPLNINSVYFWFDGLSITIPSIYMVGDVCMYKEFKIIKIVDDINLNYTYTNDGFYQVYYNSDFVSNNYSHYITKSYDELIGKYILDWSHNKDIVNMVTQNDSDYIYIDYYSSCLDEE